MADIFLSYSRDDKSRVGLLAQRLARQGWSVFWDPSIEPGHQWDEVLLRELLDARVVIVAWSAAAVRSRWVKEEANIGANRGILVPVVIDGSLADLSLPFGFGMIQAEQLADWNGSNDTPSIERLVNAVAAKLGPGPAVASERPAGSEDKPKSETSKKSVAFRMSKKTASADVDAAAAKAGEVIPLSKFELIERLGNSWHWTPTEAEQAKTFFRTLAAWRNLAHVDRLGELDALYFQFNPETYHFRPPESDEAQTGERVERQERLLNQIRGLLEFAGYEQIEKDQLSDILRLDQNAFGLNFTVDLTPYEVIELYYRGPYTRTVETRSTRFLGLMPWRQKNEIGLYQRAVAVFKLKDVEAHASEISERQGIGMWRARRIARNARAEVPPSLVTDCVYLRQFRNFHRVDLSMLIPNSTVAFRMIDKIKLATTVVGGLGIGIIGSAGKLALLATNPVAAAGTVLAFSGIAFRQAMNFVNVKQRYMVVLAQNLYLHSVADNRNVLALLSDQAEDERIIAEILSYFLLTREPVPKERIGRIKEAVSQHLLLEYGTSLRIDIDEALDRMSNDGLLVETADGKVQALAPPEATKQLEKLWLAHIAGEKGPAP